MPFYADLGDDFYAVILNTDNWTPISEIDGSNNIYLQTETGSPKQTWRFLRQSDGAYVIQSCNDGKVLEMTDPNNRKNKNPIYAITDNFWGGAYQQWYLIPQGSGYIFLSKHYQQEEWAMDYDSSNNAVQIYKRNNSKYQIWSVYKGSDSQLSGPKLTVTKGSSVSPTKFTWKDVYGEKGFNLKIWKGSSVDYNNLYTAVNDASSGYSCTLPAGTYYAYVDAYDYFHWAQGNIVTFTIPEGYTVSYHPNGGACSTTSQSVTAGLSVTLPAPTRAGYSFAGWYTTASGGTKVGNAEASYKPTKSLTLYAHWTANQYTVTLNPSSGTVSPTSIKVTYGGTYSGLPTPTRTGYTFSGWYTASSGGSKVTTSTKVTNASNHTLYARWSAIPVTKITLSKTQYLMKIDDTVTLTATVTPSNATNKAVTWTSSNTKVATVDINGKVTAVANGTATITATAKDGSGVKATCAVTVNPAYYLDLNGYLDGSNAGNIKNFGTADIYINGTRVKNDVTDYNTQWPKGTTYEIKDIKPATGCTYNGVKAGSLSGTIGDTNVSVRLSFSSVSSLELSKRSFHLQPGRSETLTATIKPSDSPTTTVTWTSSDPDVATVDGNGKVTGVTEGTATITAKAGDKSKTCTVTVDPSYYLEVTGLLDGEAADSIKGFGSFDLYIDGILASNGATAYQAKHPSSTTYEIKNIQPAAGCTYNGVAEGELSGTILEGSVDVRLSFSSVSALKLDQERLELKEEESAALTATIEPADSPTKNATWSSSNPSVATVDGNGTVSAVAPGTAEITARAGDKTVVCTVKVSAVIYEISFDVNGGNGTMESRSREKGSNFTLPDCAFTAPDGMQFRTWSVNGEEHDVGEEITVTGNLTATAIWTEADAVTQIVSIFRDGERLNVTVECSDPTAAILCAAYNGEGRMIDMRSIPVSVGTSSYLFPYGMAENVKVFVLGKDMYPLCESLAG